MRLKVLRFLSIVLAALSMTMESAHLLELPQKMHWSPEFYSQVNASLYKYFAIIGGSYQVLSLLAVVLLVINLRRRPAFRLTAVSAAFLIGAFAVWLTAVNPVNQAIGQGIREASFSVPQLWMTLRDRWEYGHAAGFFLQLIGFSFLVGSVVSECDTEPGQ